MAWPPRRRPALLMAGLAVAALGALVTVWRLNSVAQQAPVLVVVRPVHVGSAVQDADLGVTGLSVNSALAHLSAARRSDVVGKVATSELVPGSLLAPGQIGDVMPPAEGQVLTVVALPVSRMPSIGLRPGDSILVVSTPAAQADLPQGEPASIPARVVRVGSADTGGLVPIDVLVAAGDGPALAARAATGRVAVVVQPQQAG